MHVGIDTEWKPTCAMGIHTEDTSKVALIQIATRERIFLLDMIYLSEKLNAHDSHLFVEKFLFNKKIIKLGYGFTHDIKMIIKAFVDELHNSDLLRQSVLDLAYLVQQVGFFFALKRVKIF